MLYSICQQIWKTQRGHRTGKCQFSFQSQRKAMRNQRSSCQHLLDHSKSKRVPEKHLLLLYWLCQSLWLWEIQKQMGIPDHLTCLLRNLYTGQETTVRTRHGTTDLFQIGKGVNQGCILSPCLFNLYAEYIMIKAGMEEVKAGIKIAGGISITSDMQMTPPLRQKVKN